MSKESIGPKIKRFRKSRSLTQTQLAESLGYYDKSVISHIENGDVDMTYDKILSLVRKYALDANLLFDVERVDKLLDEYDGNKPKKDKVLVYIHGLHGSYKEVEDYSFLSDQYDVVGLDYQDGNPWEPKDTIVGEFKRLTKGYKEVVVIGYSIGAFYTYEYLSDFKIDKAFFISPVASMYQVVRGIMKYNHITEEQLEEEKIIDLGNNQILSHEYNSYLKNYKDNWNVKTHILYGNNDRLISFESVKEFLLKHPNASLTIKSDSEHRFKTKEEKEFIKNWILNNI